jgi:signal transduction histidine kinase
LGLGLSIAKAVLKSQRGDIHLRSEPGAGCCFTLTLPRLSDRLLLEDNSISADTDGLREELT